jgi:tRNA dimethylallyltransferase
MVTKPVICLMGPTASGKTDLALRVADEWPVDLVSVDSAQVYRGMDIGSAKLDSKTLLKYPHALIDIRDPEDKYSAGDFVRDAEREIDASHANGRIPLLVGGTMMYFRSLTEGLADLPDANESVRDNIDRQAEQAGWPALHEELESIDPVAAARIEPNDKQRIQRALEVYRTSGQTISDWHTATARVRDDYRFIKTAVIPEPRSWLHARIAERLQRMLDEGFLEEIEALRSRPLLTRAHSSMRSVGYSAFWAYLDDESTLEQAKQSTLTATRRLAKRQHTWLRSEEDLYSVNPLEVDAFASISAFLDNQLKRTKTEIAGEGL